MGSGNDPLGGRAALLEARSWEQEWKERHMSANLMLARA